MCYQAGLGTAQTVVNNKKTVTLKYGNSQFQI